MIITGIPIYQYRATSEWSAKTKATRIAVRLVGQQLCQHSNFLRNDAAECVTVRQLQLAIGPAVSNRQLCRVKRCALGFHHSQMVYKKAILG